MRLIDGSEHATSPGYFDGEASPDGVAELSPTDDYVVVGSPGTGPNLFRFFGDFDGDGTVSAGVDWPAFLAAYGMPGNPEFDFDGNGWIASLDYSRFRLNYGSSI